MADKGKDVTEIRFTVDRQFLNDLEQRLGVDKATDIARSALTLLDWASNETRAGRIILSSTESGGDLHRLVMPELAQAKARSEAE